MPQSRQEPKPPDVILTLRSRLPGRPDTGSTRSACRRTYSASGTLTIPGSNLLLGERFLTALAPSATEGHTSLREREQCRPSRGRHLGLRSAKSSQSRKDCRGAFGSRCLGCVPRLNVSRPTKPSSDPCRAEFANTWQGPDRPIDSSNPEVTTARDPRQSRVASQRCE